ncbi:UNVERIFIED_CONTAM: hypothetical protein Sradi_3412600 [Sesamum radiatum]|uniref:Uncharacterized protein n=1 Tax=Sesamum radiatum TaxID=300843 RepID=A0AAW2R529_SESRA
MVENVFVFDEGLGFILPLMVVSGLVVLVSSKSSNWLFASDYYPWAWSSVLPGASSSSSGIYGSFENNSSDLIKGVAPPPDDGGSGLELRRRVVGGGERQEAISVDYNLHRIAAPPLAVEVGDQAEPPVERRKEEFILTTNVSNVPPPSNDTRLLPLSSRIHRRFSNLQILEATLQQARAAIRDAQRGNPVYDPDYIPTGPIYWNPSAFHRHVALSSVFPDLFKSFLQKISVVRVPTS